MNKYSPHYSETIAILRKTSLFCNIDDELLDEILSHVSFISMPKKSIILPSEMSETIFIILSGRVKVSTIHPKTGREYIVSLLEPGDAFNIISLLEGEGEDEDIVIEALDNLQLLPSPISTARAWLNKHPEFNKKLFPYLGKTIRTIRKATEELALHDTMTRLVKLILKNAEKDPINKKDELIPIHLIDDLSHENLAQMIGSARKVVNQNLQLLKKEGSITSVNGRLFIKDLNKLIEHS